MSGRPRVDRAAQLRVELRELIDTSDLVDATRVVVTSDARDIGKAQALRYGAVVVLPGPDLAWPAPGVTVVTWQLVVVAKAGQLLAAPDGGPGSWDRLDELLQLLRAGGLHMVEAESGDFPVPDSPDVPGYTITCTEHFYDD